MTAVLSNELDIEDIKYFQDIPDGRSSNWIMKLEKCGQ
jgi:hypothetical protein